MADDTRSNVFPFKLPHKACLTQKADIDTMDPPPVYICKELALSRGISYVIAGYGGSKKSLFMQVLLWHISTGIPIFNRFPCRHLKCLHIDFEQGLVLTRRRYQRIARCYNMKASEGLLGIATETFKLSEKTAKNQLESLLEEYPADVVGIDSLRAGTPGVKENDSIISDYVHMVAGVCRLKGITLILIHHEGKPTKESESMSSLQRLRGHSSIGDAVDNTIRLVGQKRDVPTLVLPGKNRSGGDDCLTFGFCGQDVEIDGDPKGGLTLRYYSEKEMQTAKSEVIQNSDLDLFDKIRTFLMSFKDHTYEGSIKTMRSVLKVNTNLLCKKLDLMEKDGLVLHLRSASIIKWIGD